MSRSIVFVTASPSAASRSTLVARAVASSAAAGDLEPVFWSLADFDPADVFHGRAAAPSCARFVDSARSASAIVLASPVYKASYTGALKAIVDLVPPDALVDKPALGIATTRLEAHGAEVERAYLALFAFFRARPVDTLVVFDHEVAADGTGALSPPAEARLRRAAADLAASASASEGLRTPAGP